MLKHRRNLKEFNHGGATKKGQLPTTVIIVKGSELYDYVFDENENKRPEEEIKKLLTAAPENIKQIAISKGFWFLKELNDKQEKQM